MSEKFHEDDLVWKAENIVRKMKRSGNWDEEKGRAQTSKAIDLARGSGSLRVFMNWLRYQASRETERQPFWSLELEDGILAEILSKEMNGIKKKHGENCMEVTLLFLGYFRRALIGAQWLDRICEEE